MEVLHSTEAPPKEVPLEPSVPTPEPTQPVDQAAEPQATQPEEDLLTRVSKFVKDNDSEGKPDPEVDSTMFNDAELKQKIDQVDDPEFKAELMALRKSALSGMNDKFRELAEFKKDLQAMKEGQSVPAGWTPQRVQSLLNDPQFVQAAQQIAGETPSNGDPLEYADDGVKSVVNELKQEITALKTQSNQAIQAQTQAARQVQHKELSSRYANYVPKEIDTITADMIEGRLQATNEHLYWAMKGPENSRNAYEMGLHDGRAGKEDKIASTSIDGISTNLSSTVETKEAGESGLNFFMRLANKNMKAAQSKG